MFKWEQEKIRESKFHVNDETFARSPPIVGGHSEGLKASTHGVTFRFTPLHRPKKDTSTYTHSQARTCKVRARWNYVRKSFVNREGGSNKKQEGYISTILCVFIFESLKLFLLWLHVCWDASCVWKIFSCRTPWTSWKPFSFVSVSLDSNVDEGFHSYFSHHISFIAC